MAKKTIINTQDFEKIAARKLSKTAYDYFAGGAADEITLNRNTAAFNDISIAPRVLSEIGNRNLSTRLLGTDMAFPAFIAPIAFNRMAHPGGESAVARAAGRLGIPMIASVASNEPLEQIAKEATSPLWFQTNFYKDRELTLRLLRRAENCGCRAIVLTVDAVVWGLRERDTRNNFKLPRGLAMGNFTGEKSMPDKLPSGLKGSALAHFRKTWIEENAGWKDVAFLRSQTSLPLVLKGIQHPEDAKLAVEHGINGIIVSNHGGRQLDTARSAIEALPDIAGAVSGKIEVMMDGGIRRGTDILKALALGAGAAGIGRPAIWGLAASGEEGVIQVLEILKNEFDNAMALTGCRNIKEIKGHLVQKRR